MHTFFMCLVTEYCPEKIAGPAAQGVSDPVKLPAGCGLWLWYQGEVYLLGGTPAAKVSALTSGLTSFRPLPDACRNFFGTQNHFFYDFPAVRAAIPRPMPSSTLCNAENDDFPALRTLENHAPAIVKPCFSENQGFRFGSQKTSQNSLAYLPKAVPGGSPGSLRSTFGAHVGSVLLVIWELWSPWGAKVRSR